MFQFDKNFLLFIVGMMIALQLPFQASAQQNQRYTGHLTVGPYAGRANYQYIISDQDTIYDGAFQLQRSSLEALLDKEDSSFLFQGGFVKGIPDGDWKFQFGEFKSDSQTKVIDFEYRVRITGVQEQGNGSLKNGKPHGLWNYTVNQIKDSEIEKTLFKSEVTFENGVPQRNFQMENQKVILVGRFLRNGLAHDEWSSYDVEAIENTESWFFEEGLLRKIQVIENGKILDIPVFATSSEDYEVINLDENYIQIVRTALSNSETSFQLKNGLPDLLLENEGFYKKIDSILNRLGTADFKSQFKVQVPNFALDSLETKAINLIVEDYNNAFSNAKSLLQNSQLNILKRSDADALFYYNSLERLSESFLEPLEPFISLSESRLLQYINRSEYINQLWFNEKPSKEIIVPLDSTGRNRTFVLPNAQEFDFDGNTLASMQERVRYAKQSVLFIQGALSQQLTSAERAQALVTLEEQLIRQNETLVQKIKSVQDSLSIPFQKGLSKIQKLADISLSTYASTKNAEEKLTYGKQLTSCFEDLLKLVDATANMPEQQEEISQLYQDAIWNPFMATVMDEEVKKRITTAYHKILIPYFIQELNGNLTCDNATKLLAQMNNTYNQLKALREADTKKLERKLRKEENPLEIMKLFQEQLTDKGK
jgi:hypothetical protein